MFIACSRTRKLWKRFSTWNPNCFVSTVSWRNLNNKLCNIELLCREAPWKIARKCSNCKDSIANLFCVGYQEISSQVMVDHWPYYLTLHRVTCIGFPRLNLLYHEQDFSLRKFCKKYVTEKDSLRWIIYSFSRNK